ncbi:MAG: polysaccharide deacetylase, partial [Belnapia sp.]|nr:polysaccharide deacetylase [Belnapia sp.]
IGYRAPTFSISPSLTPWAYDILAETGHRYSSSVFPGRHAGAADAGIDPCWPGAGNRPGPVLEIPMTVLRTPLRQVPLLRQLPVAGGGPFRMTPHPLFTAGLRRVNALGRRGVFYLHPWEIDPGQPRVPGTPLLKRLKHFTGLSRMKPRLARLLADFAWDRMDAVFAAELAQSAAQPARSLAPSQPLAAA